MPNHFIEAPDDTLRTTNEMVNHEELSTLYRSAKKETLGPWLHEDERQAALEDQRLAAIAQIRRRAIQIGLLIAMPFILGALVFQAVTLLVNSLGDDVASAMILGFGGIFIGLIYFGITYASLKQVKTIFNEHALKSSPLILTILVCLLLLSQPLMIWMQQLISGLPGYVAHLITVPVASIILAVVLLYIWTIAKMPAAIKLLTLVIAIAGCAAVYYLYS